MLKRIWVEFSDDALDIIYKKYTDPAEFVQACINLGLSRISDYSDLYEVVTEDISSYPKSQRDRAKALRDIIQEVQAQHDGNAPVNIVFDKAMKIGFSIDAVKTLIKRLKREGSIFEPRNSELRVT